jgi:serine/threonine-protein kinase
MHNSSTPLPALSEFTPGRVIGKYRIERVIGEGAMGFVVEATNLDLDERVALKFMRESSLAGEEALERFGREARAAAKLKSEHVARVYDVGTFNGAPFIVMEYLEGRDLEQLIAQSGPLPISSAVLYMIQACEALAEAHARGIVHRDIKPANIFIVERGGWQVAKVLDFGVSKIARRSDGSRPSLKDTCGLVGSPSTWRRSDSARYRRSCRPAIPGRSAWCCSRRLPVGCRSRSAVA